MRATTTETAAGEDVAGDRFSSGPGKKRPIEEPELLPNCDCSRRFQAREMEPAAISGSRGSGNLQAVAGVLSERSRAPVASATTARNWTEVECGGTEVGSAADGRSQPAACASPGKCRLSAGNDNNNRNNNDRRNISLLKNVFILIQFFLCYRRETQRSAGNRPRKNPEEGGDSRGGALHGGLRGTLHRSRMICTFLVRNVIRRTVFIV